MEKKLTFAAEDLLLLFDLPFLKEFSTIWWKALPRDAPLDTVSQLSIV